MADPSGDAHGASGKKFSNAGAISKLFVDLPNVTAVDFGERHYKAAEKAFSKLRALMTKPRSARPIIACDDPVEAYVQACIASPFFSYVSPEIYSLCDTRKTATDD
ncbi:hypothetical protein IB237_15695 [Agrobacterium sp. AGB01]|uniref:hypothetical protein n=1 Tax=Agrobacterium sp. AGB01 TaxID=2769302 RepID=UPI001782990B|nr:hypothetical protein [Agrobacterium sp. AGB01]MBD9388624.1 hypothetical protein [Agrobacterium sp. AGB01]